MPCPFDLYPDLSGVPYLVPRFFGQGGTGFGPIMAMVCGVLVRQFRVFGEDTYLFDICVILRVTGSAVSAELSSIRTNSGTAGQSITTTVSEDKARDRSAGQKST